MLQDADRCHQGQETMDSDISDNSPERMQSYVPEVRGRGSRRRAGRAGRAGRGRGRGRPDAGRRAAIPPQPNRADVMARTREDRDRQMQNDQILHKAIEHHNKHDKRDIAFHQDRIQQLSLEDMRDIMLRAYQQQPSFVFRILEHKPQPDQPQPDPPQPDQPQPDPPQPDQPQPDPPQPGQDRPDWCRCNHCREMSTDVEKRCRNQTPLNCHIQLLDFGNVILDPLVLEVAMRYRNDMLAQPPDVDYNRAHRHTAYRQYILGAGNRQVIPSCCVWAIRDRYLDPSGQCVGFLGGRFA